jgi:hypothetical protein
MQAGGIAEELVRPGGSRSSFATEGQEVDVYMERLRQMQEVTLPEGHIEPAQVRSQPVLYCCMPMLTSNSCAPPFPPLHQTTVIGLRNASSICKATVTR